MGTGQLKFSVANAYTGTGFSSVGRFTFTDRPPDQNPNRGSGNVQIQYLALPNAPTAPVLVEGNSSTGSIILAVASDTTTVPTTTEVCLSVITIIKCRPNSSTMVQFESTDWGLQVWTNYQFRAFYKNSVGQSESSASAEFGIPQLTRLDSIQVSTSVDSESEIANYTFTNSTHLKQLIGLTYQYEWSGVCAPLSNITPGQDIPNYTCNVPIPSQSSTLTAVLMVKIFYGGSLLGEVIESKIQVAPDV